MTTFLKPWIWILLCYTVGLWWYCVPFTGDEKVYTSIAMEMWEKKSWLYPLLFGEHTYYKPPFQFWATLVSWKIFGFGNLGAYFPSVLALTATAWLMTRIQNRLGKTSDTAGVWFAGCFGTLTYGTTLQMEIWLVFFSMAVWWALLKFQKSYALFRHSSWIWLYTALGLAGISGLVKSPLYSVLSVLGIWIYLILQKEFNLFKKLQFYLAHIFGVLLGISWYASIFIFDKERFWNHYVSTETLSKLEGNNSSVLRMWADFATFGLPFTLLFIPVLGNAFFFLWKRLQDWKNLKFPLEARTSFLLSSTLLPSVFFSSFPYRTETYLYLILPSLILWMDWTLSEQMDIQGRSKNLKAKNRRFIWAYSDPENILGFRNPNLSLPKIFSESWSPEGLSGYLYRINGILILILALVASLILTLGKVIPFAIGLLLSFSAASFCYFSWKLKWRQIAFSTLAMITIVRLGAVCLGEADIRTLKDVANRYPNREFAFYDDGRSIWHEMGVLSIGIGRVCQRLSNLNEVLQALQTQKILVLSDTQKDRILPEIQREVAAKGQNLNQVSWKRWKRGFQVPSLNDLLQLSDQTSKEWELKNKKEYVILFN